MSCLREYTVVTCLRYIICTSLGRPGAETHEVYSSMQLALATCDASRHTFIPCAFLMYAPVMQQPIKFAVHYKKHHANPSQTSSERSSVVQRTLLPSSPVSSLLLPEYYGWVPHVLWVGASCMCMNVFIYTYMYSSAPAPCSIHLSVHKPIRLFAEIDPAHACMCCPNAN